MKKAMLWILTLGFGVVLAYGENGDSTIDFPEETMSIQDQSRLPFLESPSNVQTENDTDEFSGIGSNSMKTETAEPTGEHEEYPKPSDFYIPIEQIQQITNGPSRDWMDRTTNVVIDNRRISKVVAKIETGSFGYFGLGLDANAKIGKIEFGFDYRRDRFQNIWWNTNEYANTSYDSDAFSGVFVNHDSEELNACLKLDYVYKRTGLTANPLYNQDSMEILPIRYGVVADFSKDLRIQSGFFFKSIGLKYGTVSRLYWESGIEGGAVFRPVAFILSRIGWEYRYSELDGAVAHHGNLRAIQTWDILPAFGLDFGIKAFIYSRYPFFWAPELTLHYTNGSDFAIRAGISGEREEWMDQVEQRYDQADSADIEPASYWKYFAETKLAIMTNFRIVGGAAFLQSVTEYRVALDANYRYVPTTVSGVFRPEAYIGMEIQPFAWLKYKMEYQFRPDAVSGELMNPAHRAFVECRVSDTNFGMEAATSFRYVDTYRLSGAVSQPAVVLWNFDLKGRMWKDIYIVWRVENILNQSTYKNLFTPRGGFGSYFGIEVGL